MDPDPEPYDPSLLDYVDDFFVGLSPGWLLIDTLGLLALAIWLARKAWPLGRIVHALHTAPPATVRSSAQGTVKLSGRAFPGSEHSGSRLTRTPYVWCVYSKFDSRSIVGSGRSGSYSVAPIIVRDATGECVVNPQEATVLHTLVKGKSRSHMFGESTMESERLILPGDAVIAIGELRRNTEKANPRAPATFRLHKPKYGVLLVSGKSERHTRIRFHVLFWLAALPAALCAYLSLNGFSVHVGSYPGQSLAEYADALVSRPGQSYPGPQSIK